MILSLLLLLQDEARIDREVAYANDPEKPQYQDQAIQRLRARGADAVPAILRFVEKNGKNRLAIFFTEFLGEIKDERISRLLVSLLEDPDFFWRPSAAKALAMHARPADRDLFRKFLGDRLWGVRVFAIRALEKLGDREPDFRAMLSDPQYDVRAQAAKTLFAFGDESGLPILVESLSSEVDWFGIDYGQIAREDAWNFLKKITKDDFGFKPWEPRADREPGLRRWQEWMERKDPKWRDRVPPKARSSAPKSDWSFGFELRSCQRGEYFFRIDSEGNFVLGYFNLEIVKLSDDERRSLRAAIETVAKIDRTVPYGRGGCDFEQYYFRGGGGFEKLWIGLEGRPRAADVFVRTVAAIVRNHFGEGEAKEFVEMTSLFQARN